MSRICVAVSGDQWCNREEVLAAIARNQGASHLVLEINTEGPSLEALGITQAVLQATAQIGITADRIWVDRWHNTVEQVPFRRATQPGISHFFWMSDDYRHVQPCPHPAPHVFGLFVGRATAPRAVIMHELWHQHRPWVLFSLMRGHGASVNMTQDLADWAAPDQALDIQHWFYDPPIHSVTDHCVRDQYTGGHNTNAALAAHYGRFCVEVVCETYCKGDTFFPTEKTVRPLALGKAMLVYGPRHFLRRLRGLGFQTWHTVWDESYDDLDGPDRWRVMREVIAHIVRHGSWQDPVLSTVADHNRSVLEDLIKRHRPL